MSKKKTNRLSDIVPQFAPQGANDRKWAQVERQLWQAKSSLQDAHRLLKDIRDLPENDNEYEMSLECVGMVAQMLRGFVRPHATFLSYLSDTDVPGRISRKEL